MRFAAWPEISEALKHPSVQEVRPQHWTRVLCGRLDDGFEPSAKRLASAFYDHGVPAYAVAICHAAVTAAMNADLRARPRSWRERLLTRQLPKLEGALTKLAWLDLEVLLETYSEAEQASRSAVLRGVAETFDLKMTRVVQGIGNSAAQFDSAVRLMAEAAGRSSVASHAAAGAAHDATGNVGSVAASIEELAASVAEIGQRLSQAAGIATRAVEEAGKTDAPSSARYPTGRTGLERSSALSATSPARRTCSRSMPPSRPRALGRPVRGSPSWLPR